MLDRQLAVVPGSGLWCTASLDAKTGTGLDCVDVDAIRSKSAMGIGIRNPTQASVCLRQRGPCPWLPYPLSPLSPVSPIPCFLNHVTVSAVASAIVCCGL